VSYLIGALELALIAIGVSDAAAQELHSYVVDTDASQVYVVVHRAGLFSFLGHEHAIVPERWSSEMCLANPLPEGAHASLTLETSSLVIDTDAGRRMAGLDGGPDDDTRKELQTKMLDAEHLDGAQFPEVRLQLRSVEAAHDDLVGVEGTITIHGVMRDVAFPVRVDGTAGGTLLLRGTLRIRQRDFGVEPESKAGLVKVANEVDLQFALLAKPGNQTCSGR